jgi:hypothetical protein
MARSRRSYTRDSRGRFASTPGGPARAASGLPKRQARKMGTPPPRRRGLVTQRAAVRRSTAKLKGLDASGSYSGALKQRGQRAAVTRAANRLQAAQQSGRRRLRAGAQQGVIRSRQRPATGKPKVRIRIPRSAGTVAKPKGLKVGALAERRAAKAAKARGLRVRIDGDAFAARSRRAKGASLRRAINESDRENALTSAQRRAAAPGNRYAASNMRQARADRTAAAAQDFYRNYGSPSAFSLRPRLSTANSPGFGSKRRSRRRR